ncbi:MAG: tyrosine-type recombinase/integrase, partial [Anaerolineae bacterium]
MEQFEAYLSSSALAPATVVNYMADLRAFLRWSESTNGATRSPLDLDTDDVQAYCSFLQQSKSHAPATVNRRIQTLRKFYTFAQDQGWTLLNPAEDVSLLREPASQRSRHLSDRDVARLQDAVRDGRRRWVHRDWAILQVLLHAGLKLGELTDLRVDNVRLKDKRPCLEVRGTSGELDRDVPLDDQVCDALQAYLSARQAAPEEDALFVNRDGNPLSTRSVQRLLHRYAKVAGLDGLTTQALRYYYATSVYEQSGDLQTVADMLGHRHLATTVRYLRPSMPSQESF